MRAFGVDISKWDVNQEKTKWWNPDNAKKPIDFVIQRLSYGGRTDECVDILYPQSLKIPIRGCYHYYSTAIGAKEQADVFLKIINGKEFHFLAVDYEKYYNNLNSNSLKEFRYMLDYVYDRTGKTTLAYFNPDVYNTLMKVYGADSWINNYETWIAQYPFAAFYNPEKNPYLPKDVKKWKIWQTSGGDVANTIGKTLGSTYGAIRQGIDTDLFNGTKEDMMLWLKIDGTKKPPISIEPPVNPREQAIRQEISELQNRIGRLQVELSQYIK